MGGGVRLRMSAIVITRIAFIVISPIGDHDRGEATRAGRRPPLAQSLDPSVLGWTR